MFYLVDVIDFCKYIIVMFVTPVCFFVGWFTNKKKKKKRPH